MIQELMKTWKSYPWSRWFYNQLFTRLFKENFKLIATDLSKQHGVDADPKAIQQIDFTGNLDWIRNATIFFILEEVKETISDFSQGTMKAL